MIAFNVECGDLGRLAAVMHSMAAAGRAQLNRVGANAVLAHTQRYIHGYAAGKHATAATLGATPTGHYEKGVAAMTAAASPNEAAVLIPIPGISRALRDIRLTTPTRNGRHFLTIPRHAAAYGHTVSELKMRGWTIFRPGQKHCLLGYRQKGEKPVMLYTLAERVTQERDGRLLPDTAELSRIFAASVKQEINRVLRKTLK